jgi:hypothetical protein
VTLRARVGNGRIPVQADIKFSADALMLEGRAELRRVERNGDGTFLLWFSHGLGVELRTHTKKRGEPRKA